MSRQPVGLVLLIGLAAAGATCKGSDPGKQDPPPPSAPADTGAAPARAPAVQEVPGFDVAQLEPSVRADALRLLNETYCYCGCPRTIAACLAAEADCSCVRCSKRMASFIMNEYELGSSTEDVEAQLLGGFSEGFNGRPRKFDQPDQPRKGPADAKIELVEFADFRCPHCAAAYDVLEQVVKSKSDVALRYYYFPLSGGGETSIRAAEAAEEAREQGKFWEMARTLFKFQHALEESDLRGYAQDVGLDMAKFDAAMKSRKHKEKVLEDKRLGEQVGVLSTPSIYLNGRPFQMARTIENIELRIEMEAERGRCD